MSSIAESPNSVQSTVSLQNRLDTECAPPNCPIQRPLVLDRGAITGTQRPIRRRIRHSLRSAHRVQIRWIHRIFPHFRKAQTRIIRRSSIGAASCRTDATIHARKRLEVDPVRSAWTSSQSANHSESAFIIHSIDSMPMRTDRDWNCHRSFRPPICRRIPTTR